MSFDPKNASQKAQLYPILKALADMDPRKSAELIMDDAVGYPIPHGKDYASNMRKGQINKTLAKLTHDWLMKHHFDLAHRISPEIFPQTPEKRWREIVEDRAIKGNLTIQLVKASMGVVQRDSQLQTADTTIRLGQRFCLQLDSDFQGHVVALQGRGDIWEVIELGNDGSMSAPIQQGINRLPRLPNGDIDPLNEATHEGIHDFVMVKSPENNIPTGIKRLLSWVNDTEHELHHISVRFGSA